MKLNFFELWIILQFMPVSLAYEVKCGGKVLVGVAGVAHDPVDVQSHGPQGRWASCPRRRILRQPQILHHEGRPKSTLI